ncbi:MAG: BMP family ABC transporter substrate-binding protein, partial [Firmicutes bacterium]|nr:BMP family ABC transporter substrate-binding protein [Bacillota bacterium]
MKKILSVLLTVAMIASLCLALASCGNKEENEGENAVTLSGDMVAANAPVEADTTLDKSDFKIGFIRLHDENSTYDKNFMDAALKVKEEFGLTDEQVVFKTNVAESNDCYEAAVDFADSGCDIVFADSFGHESHIIRAAKEFPEVQFCHATGTQAQISGLDNFHNAFASIYEGRYLAGIAAGMKLNEMIDDGKITAEQAKIGYVGAFNYAEVVSGFTSFFLGARSVCPSATMEVVYTNSWFDIALEKEAANTLMDNGCVLVSQHADSEGAPKACEARNVPNVAYNISTISMAPTTALISSKIDWTPYFRMIINAELKGEKIPTDWCGSIASESVILTELNETVAAEGTAEAIATAIDGFKNGTLKVFDTTKFTVGGK